MKCTECREHAVVDVRRHNAGFCKDHFIEHIHGQVVKAIKDFDMFSPEDRLLIAVSGGKDSLAIWDILIDLGYDTTGFYLDLGIGGYSTRSKEASSTVCTRRSAVGTLITIDSAVLVGVTRRAGYRDGISRSRTARTDSSCSTSGVSSKRCEGRVVPRLCPPFRTTPSSSIAVTVPTSRPPKLSGRSRPYLTTGASASCMAIRLSISAVSAGVRAEALAGGQRIGKRWETKLMKERHIWFKDLAQGGSSALQPAVALPAAAAALVDGEEVSALRCRPGPTSTGWRRKRT